MIAARPGELLAGRYLLVAPLGEGASSVVFRARDRWEDRDVAVKILQGDDAVGAARRELAVAGDAADPGLARALDVGRLDAAVFLVLELAEGKPFDRALSGTDPATVGAALDQLFAALAPLHGRRLVHGDLKPENVLVGWSGGRVEVRLLDLGLARPEGRAGGGNAVYCAPERLGGAASRASDLFSVGLMAYEALHGRLPFGDPDDPGYLGRLARGTPVPVDGARAGALAPLLRRLLAAEPAVRPRSATAARAALREAVDLPPPRAVVSAPPLLGRTEALGRIQGLLARWIGGDPLRAVLVGERGAGRSVLLRRLGAEARLLGARTLEVSALDGPRRMLRSLAEGAEALGAGDVARGCAVGDGTHGAALSVLRALERIGRRGPLLVAVDDVDRADREACEVLRFLAGARGPVAWVRVDGAAEADEARLGVDALSIDAVQRLLEAMLPGIDGAETMARAVHERTAGRPRDVVAGVHRLVAAGAVRRLATGWRRSPEMDGLGAFVDAHEHELRRRVEGVSAQARHLLAAGSLAGGAIEVAARAMGVEEPIAKRCVHEARTAGLLRRSGSQLVLASDEVGRVLVQGLSATRRRELRERLADALLGCPEPALRAVGARHLLALGRIGEGCDAAEEAARAACDGGDRALAVALYADARRHGGMPVVRRVALEEASMRCALGQSEEALELLAQAESHGVDADAVERVRGEAFARAGRYDEAIERLWGRTGSASDRYWLGWSLMMRGRYEEAASVAEAEAHDPRDAARLERLRGTIAWHRGRLDEAVGILRRALEHARRAADPLLEVEAGQSLGTAERMRGDLDAAVQCFAEAIRVARARGYAGPLAKALNNLAIAQYQGGRWREAEHAWEAMHDIASRLGAREEVLLSQNNLGLLRRDRGELARAERSLLDALRIAEQDGLGRYEAMARGNLAEVRLLAGDLDRAAEDLRRTEELARELGSEDELVECRRRRAALTLARGDAAAAFDQAREAAAAARELGQHVEAGLALLLATAAARTLGRTAEARLQIGAARKAIERGGTRLERAKADLEEAEIHVATGNVAGARRLARAASEVLEELGAERELERARALETGEVDEARARDLVEVLRFATAAPDVPTLLDGVLERILEMSGAERGFVVTLEGDAGPRIAARRSVHGDPTDMPVLSRGIADEVVASGRTIVLADVGDRVELATRESVASLGLRAALCAPLLRGGHCLGLLYVDSTRGAELLRVGQWTLDAVTAVVVPALERLGARDRDLERMALLESTAVDALAVASAMDAALELLEEEPDPERRRELVRVARERLARSTARSRGLLDLLRVDAPHPEPPERVSPEALLGCALDVFRGAAFAVEARVRPGAAAVLGRLEPLTTVITQLVELVGAEARQGAVVNVTAEPSEDEGPLPGLVHWRPGASAGRRFVRFEVSAELAAGRAEPFEREGSGAVAMRVARRIVRGAQGVLREERSADRLRMVVDLPAADPSAEREAA